MGAESRNPLATHRYQHKSRVFLESFAKVGVTSGLAFVLVLHLYAAFVLLANDIPSETIYPTLVFDGFVGGGCFALLAACGRGKRGPLVEWLSWFVVAVVTIYAWIFFIEYLGLSDLTYLYFPGVTVVYIAWCGVLLLSFGYIVGAGIGAIASFFRHGAVLRQALPRSRTMSGLTFLCFLALVLISPLVTNLVIAEGTVKRTVSIKDTNDDCNLCVWDLPDFLGTARIGTSTDINVGLFSTNQTRVLNAFAKMNTTFYSRPGIDGLAERNQTIAWLKVLDAFNLTLCWVVKDDFNDFPGPGNPESWIHNAREVLEFVIDENITSVVGICADSESGIEAPPEEYWANITLYDKFLREIQTNASLAHPDPARGTFDTVLCYSPLSLADFVDGDQDITVWDGELGLPPDSWSKYTFMIYRVFPGDSPSFLQNYLVLAKKYIGMDTAIPIVGLAGVNWFAEGYMDGMDATGYFDGVDGWDAMKREILYPKAMGFRSVSVFHLNAYASADPTECRGLLDYYGIDAIEDLADGWTANLTIEYPISSMDFKIGGEAFFNPNSDVVYDLLTNAESLAVMAILLALTVAYSALKAAAKWLFPASYHVIERGRAGTR